MKKAILLILLVLLILGIISKFHSNKKPCGVERWKVKTLTDKDTSEINFFDTLKSSVEEQGRLEAPHKLNKNTSRLKGECSLISVDCYILEYKKEDDNDYHVVIKDLLSESTMIAEIPCATECEELKESGHYNDLKNIRQWFEEHIGIPSDHFKKCHPPVKARITGVGFFDFIHGQTGIAPNGRELHPILKIELLK
jgi:hypothetical protein